MEETYNESLNMNKGMTLNVKKVRLRKIYR